MKPNNHIESDLVDNAELFTDAFFKLSASMNSCFDLPIESR